MWDLPRPGIKPMSPALSGGFFTIEPPGKPSGAFKNYILNSKRKTLKKNKTKQTHKLWANQGGCSNSFSSIRSKASHFPSLGLCFFISKTKIRLDQRFTKLLLNPPPVHSLLPPKRGVPGLTVSQILVKQVNQFTAGLFRGWDMLMCVWISKIPRLGGAGTELYDPAWPLKSFLDENANLRKTDLEGLWGPLNSNKPYQDEGRIRQWGHFQTRQGKALKAKLKTTESIRQSKQLRGAAGSKSFCVPGQTRIWMGEQKWRGCCHNKAWRAGNLFWDGSLWDWKDNPSSGQGRGQETYKLPQMISRCSGRNAELLNSVGREKSDCMRTKKKSKTNRNCWELLRSSANLRLQL